MPPADKVTEWDNQIERIVLGNRNTIHNCRSPGMVGQLCNLADVSVRHKMDKRTLRYEQHRLQRDMVEASRNTDTPMVRAKGAAPRRTFRSTWDKLVERWGWQYLGPDGGGTRWSTDVGEIDLARDSAKAIHRATEAAWSLDRWARDNRANDEEDCECFGEVCQCSARFSTQMLLRTKIPVFDIHREQLKTNWADRLVGNAGNMGEDAGTVALGYYADWRRWNSENKHGIKHGKTAVSLTCECGHALPDRRHFVWDCPVWSWDRSDTLRRNPVCQMEEALMLPLIDKPRPPPSRRMTPPTMVRYLASGDDTIWVATDGRSDYPSINGTEAGKICDEALRRASWSVVVKAGQREPQKWGGVLGGFDQTAYQAELWSVHVAARAAKLAKANITFIIDNKSVNDELSTAR